MQRLTCKGDGLLELLECTQLKHAEPGRNCSTLKCILCGSPRADPFISEGPETCASLQLRVTLP